MPNKNRWGEIVSSLDLKKGELSSDMYIKGF
jgi:hypothetical protein